MKPITAQYDGHKLILTTVSDELQLRDAIIGTVKSYANARSHWFACLPSISMAQAKAVQELKNYSHSYAGYSLRAVILKLQQLQPHLYLIAPNPNGKQKHWCEKLDFLNKIITAYLNDSKSISGQR